MSEVPKAVKEQAEEADRKLAELQEAESNANEETTTIPVVEEPPVVTPSEPPSALNDQINALEVKKEAEAEIHKLKSEEGRHKKRIEELEEELRRKEEELRLKEQEAANVKSTEIEVIDPNLFTDEEKDFLGEDYINMAEKIVQNAINRSIGAIEEKFSKQFQNIEETTFHNNSAVFIDRLVASLGLTREQFDKVDQSAQFEAYLREEDDSGNIRFDSLNHHIANQSLEKTAKIYKGFLATLNTAKDTPPKRAPQPTRAAGQGAVIDINQTPITYRQVAELYTSGRISRAEKDALEARLNEQLNNMQ
jgi:hypothetical protein